MEDELQDGVSFYEVHVTRGVPDPDTINVEVKNHRVIHCWQGEPDNLTTWCGADAIPGENAVDSLDNVSVCPVCHSKTLSYWCDKYKEEVAKHE